MNCRFEERLPNQNGSFETGFVLIWGWNVGFLFHFGIRPTLIPIGSHVDFARSPANNPPHGSPGCRSPR